MDRRARMAATPARRVRFLLSGVLALAVLTGGSLYLARSEFFAGQASSRATVNPRATAAGCDAAAASTCPGNPAYLAVAAPPAVVTVPPRRARTSPSASPSSRPPSPRPTTLAAVPSASPSAPAGGTAAAQVLALINQARAAAGLPALTITAGLETSSSQHNLLMADGCGLSHQCPGEPPLGDRETAAGVDWTSAGENIGEGGPVADTDAAIAQMAVGLTQSMLNEQPPDDGHRLNILSSSFTHIGIAVYRDSSGTVWLTQDFSN
ncbi:MAG TPA: CAP domain-containing protein [Trebonia sp.]|nr:CAP domain-containing protein [Trebonia sp.]